MTKRLTRRGLLRTVAVGSATAVASRVFPAPALLAQASPNSTLGIAVIGCANQGFISVNEIARLGERLVALIDVDENHLGKTRRDLAERYPELKTSAIQTFYDYRRALDALAKRVDAVFVCAPDHHHAPAAMIAMGLGKAVYVEKPLAHTIHEVRTLMAAARQHKVITQLGNQGHSGEGIRRLSEYLDAGAIGQVTEVHAWAPTGRGGTGGRLPTEAVPSGLHWDEWIGPMPYRDYHAELHPKDWRSWWDFGDGSVGDWGCHNLDGAFMALRLGSPTTVEAVAQTGGSAERFPLLNTIRWDFPARGNLAPVKVFWYDGYRGLDSKTKDEDNAAAQKAQNRPPLVLELEKKYSRDLKNGGTIYVGEKGVMLSGNYVGSPRILPEEQHRQFPVPAKKLPRVKGTHQADFLRACKDGQPACSHFDYSGPLTEMVLLGCLAIKAGPGKKVVWDAAAMQCTNLPELNTLVKREYRKGWGLS